MRSRPLVGGLSSVLLSLIISLDSPWRARATVPPSPPPPPLTPANIEIQCETGHCVPDGTPTQTLVVPLSVQVELIFSGSESYFLAADSFKLVSGVDCDTGVAASGTLDARRRATVLITTTDPLTLCTTSFDGRAYRHPEVTVTASTSIHPPPPLQSIDGRCDVRRLALHGQRGGQALQCHQHGTGWVRAVPLVDLPPL